MIVSSYLESFIHLYHYFLYKWAEGLACTKQTKDTTNSIQEGADEFFSVLKMVSLINLAVSSEQLPGTAPTWLLPTSLFSLSKTLPPFSWWGILHLTSGICRKDVGKAFRSHCVWFDRSVYTLFSLHIQTLVTGLLPSPPHGSKYNVCHVAAVYPVHGKVQLPWRERRGNPVTSLALGMVICNHSNIPAKELHNIHLESSGAVVCEDHSSSFNYSLKSLRTF